MRLLFEELTKKCLPSEERIGKYKDWIRSAEKARSVLSQERTVLDKKANQYDKAEELITFYTFAPLCLRENKEETVKEILRLANVKIGAGKIESLDFERHFPPPPGYLNWLGNHANEHPVKYLREQAEDHKKNGKDLETATHVDFAIETSSLLVLIEVKFTSDISDQTTFNPYRNQLARLVDVGITAAKEKGKRLIVLLCSPSAFFVTKSRLYFYKIKEYADYKEIYKDIGWRSQEDIEKYLLSVSFIPIEELIRIIYSNFEHSDKREALDFFVERNIVS